GTEIETIGYTYEDIKIEKPGPEPGPGPVVDPVVTVTDAEILSVLNEKLTVAAAQSLGWRNEANIQSPTWYVTKDGDNVTGANLLFNYKMGNMNQIILCKVDFASPLTPQDIKDGKVGTPTYTSVYDNGIDTTIQEQHAALADAIGDKVFGVNADATRYIIDNGTTGTDPQFGEAARFTVIEVSDTGIKEKSINIAYANTDAGLIAKLSNEANYYTHDDKTCEISGTKVEATQETASARQMSRQSVRTYYGEDEVGNDDDLIM
ncbi:MAG: hypothetical protein NC183_06935, partial [Corallococcus sp.]|nr:hypothetical protein [Corallococcus sp.]